MTPEKQTEMHLKKMTSDLDLTPEQQEKIKPILLEKAQKREEKKAEFSKRKASGEKLSREEKSEIKDTMKSEKEIMKDKLKNILTSEQMEKWENNRMEKKEKIKEQMQKRRNDRK